MFLLGIWWGITGSETTQRQLHHNSPPQHEWQLIKLGTWTSVYSLQAVNILGSAFPRCLCYSEPLGGLSWSLILLSSRAYLSDSHKSLLFIYCWGGRVLVYFLGAILSFFSNLNELPYNIPHPFRIPYSFLWLETHCLKKFPRWTFPRWKVRVNCDMTLWDKFY